LKSLANAIKAILIKDLLTELRAKQLLPMQLCLGLLIAWVFRIAVEAVPSDTSVTASAVLLIGVLFSAILASEKTFSVEHQNDGISALLLAPVDAGDIYIAKLLVNIIMLCIFEIVIVPVIIVLFRVSIDDRWPGLIVVLLLANVGISSIGTLMGCAVQGAKAQNSLLSILLMATLSPMMIPLIFALRLLFAATGKSANEMGTLAMASDFGTAIGFLTAFDAIFVTVCWLLFGFVVSEQEK
jgi:ABC-type transport system involved in cytochrome c biogenesis permease component